MSTKIQNFEFIECPIAQGSTQTRYYFPDQPQLRYVSLLNLVAYNENAVPFSILSGNANVTQSEFAQTFLVLYANDKEAINRIPLTDLNSVVTNGQVGVFARNAFAGQQVIWAKSYIQTTQAYDTTNAASVCLGVYYA
jgi:hypothetical protein